jgi:hypothetical protein
MDTIILRFCFGKEVDIGMYIYCMYKCEVQRRARRIGNIIAIQQCRLPRWDHDRRHSLDEKHKVSPSEPAPPASSQYKYGT